MCRRVECPKCSKPTYTGCGMHVEQVLGDVPKKDRCTCDEAKTNAPPKEPVSLFRRIFGG